MQTEMEQATISSCDGGKIEKDEGEMTLQERLNQLGDQWIYIGVSKAPKGEFIKISRTGDIDLFSLSQEHFNHLQNELNKVDSKLSKVRPDNYETHYHKKLLSKKDEYQRLVDEWRDFGEREVVSEYNRVCSSPLGESLSLKEHLVQGRIGHMKNRNVFNNIHRRVGLHND